MWNTARSDYWTILIPDTWRQVEDEEGNQITFENLQQTMFIYISSYTSKLLESISEDDIKNNIEIEKRSIAEWPDSKFIIVKNAIFYLSNSIIGFVEFFDEARQIRVQVKYISHGQLWARFSLHNYCPSNDFESIEIAKKILDSAEVK